GTVGRGVSTFSNTGLAAGTTFTYRVQAFIGARSSAFSNTASATTTGGGGGGGGGALRRHALVGYWHNFVNGAGPLRLRDVSTSFDVVNVAFAEPVPGSFSNMQFSPDPNVESVDDFKADVAALKARGQRVVISVGGANGVVQLNNAAERDAFVNSMTGIVNTFGFQGIDVDLE